MRLLDLFCKAGGAAVGYNRAGFDEIVGVDIQPQARYPFQFILGNALEYLVQHGHEFDAIHASPPCQAFSSMKGMWNAKPHDDLLTPIRTLLIATDKPYVIENVPGAPMENYIWLCGSMFGLGSHDAELRRHRWFEIHPAMIWLRPPCGHHWKSRTNTVLSHGGNGGSRTVGVYGHSGGHSIRDNTQGFSKEERQQAMGIDWMLGDELAQAIPPAYTEFIGKRLLEIL